MLAHITASEIEAARKVTVTADENATIEKGDVRSDEYTYADEKNKLEKELKRENENNAKTLKKKRGTFVQVMQ